MNRLYFILLLILAVPSCLKNPSQTGTPSKPHTDVAFDADSAYRYAAAQVAFGPRVPGSEAHSRCAEYLENTLSRFADTVITQRGSMTAYDGSQMPVRNIIAALNADVKRRVMLSAHYDTRPWADQDADSGKWHTPIDGANDGASGVAVLLEIARQLNAMHTDLGVDIVLWDAEDGGTPQFDEHGRHDSWCLGSQYWAKHKHKAGYEAQCGILLDMVGAEDARFLLEQHSRQYAGSIMKSIWQTARRLGYGDIFVEQNAYPLVDDHYYLNLAGIPTVDIIHYDNQRGFPAQWHTTKDNMDHISPLTLGAVGHTVLDYIVNR